MFPASAQEDYLVNAVGTATYRTVHAVVDPIVNPADRPAAVAAMLSTELHAARAATIPPPLSMGHALSLLPTIQTKVFQDIKGVIDT